MATTKTITNAWVNKILPDIFYEDPEPVEDHLQQYTALFRISKLLMERYGDLPDVFASGGGFVFYDRANGNRRVAPDFYMAFDVDEGEILRNLPNFWIWEIGKPPDFVLEVASKSTAQNDMGPKRALYERIGVQEYWRCDSTGGDFYGQPLVGERLVGGKYRPYELRIEPDGSVKAYSELLDLDFHWDGEEFDLLDPATGKTIDRFEAAEAQADAERVARLTAEDRAEAERAARLSERLQAEARERELMEEIERLRSQQSR